MNRIILITVFTVLTFNVMAREKVVQTSGRTQLGEFAPKFAELNDDVLFGEVWSRTDKLGLRDRSLVTPYRRTQYGVCQIFHRQQLPRTGFVRAGKYLQRDFRASLPQQLAHP